MNSAPCKHLFLFNQTIIIRINYWNLIYFYLSINYRVSFCLPKYSLSRKIIVPRKMKMMISRMNQFFVVVWIIWRFLSHYQIILVLIRPMVILFLRFPVVLFLFTFLRRFFIKWNFDNLMMNFGFFAGLDLIHRRQIDPQNLWCPRCFPSSRLFSCYTHT